MMKLIRWTLLLLLLLAAGSVWAQIAEIELSERLEYQGEFSISYPAGWVTDISSPMPIIANSEEVLFAIFGEGEAADDSFALVVFLPAAIERNTGLPADTPPEEMIEGLAALFDAEAEIEIEDWLGFSVPVAVLSGGEVPDDVRMTALEVDDGTMAFLILAPDYEGYLPVLLEMLQTMEYSSSAVSITSLSEIFTFASGVEFGYPEGWLVEELTETQALLTDEDGTFVAIVYDLSDERLMELDYEAPVSDDPYAWVYTETLYNYVDAFFEGASMSGVGTSPYQERTVVSTTLQLDDAQMMLLILPMGERFAVIEALFDAEIDTYEAGSWDTFQAIGRSFAQAE